MEGMHRDPVIDVTPGPTRALVTLDEQHTAQVDQDRRAKLELYLGNLYSENTEAAYRGDWNHWLAWCEQNQRAPMPATARDVLDYLLDYAEVLKPTTLERRLVTIGKAHKSFGEEPPTRDERVKKAYRGLIRTHGRRVKRAAPILAGDIKALVDAAGTQDRLLARRDKALLLLGWFGAFRQAELVQVELEHIEKFDEDEWSVLIPKSKTDQAGEGKRKWLTRQDDLRYCPLRALDKWKKQAEVEDGRLLRSIGRWGHVGKSIRPQAVTDTIRRCADLAGYDPKMYSGHSLRRGFCVQAAINGATLDEIMAQTHHRDISTVMKYIEEANARRRNAVRKIGL
jgi:site-specific recombinase XerD